MNKRTFTLELTTKPNGNFKVFIEEIEEIIRRGVAGYGSVSIQNNCQFQIVEQIVEPSQNKTIQLLEKAESVLSDSEHRYHWSVAKELRNHLDELQGKNKENEDKS